MVPIVILCGEAGSGKDTFGEFIAQGYKGVCIAQADPVKFIAKKLFGFSDEALWGPSAARNALNEDLKDLRQNQQSFAHKAHRLRPFIDSLFQGARKPYELLVNEWFDTISDKSRNDGGLTARWVLQVLGTDWARSFDADVWNRYAYKMARVLLAGGHIYVKNEAGCVSTNHPGYNLVVITDGRFRNEIVGIKTAGGLAIKIARPNNALTSAVASAGVAGHRSEVELSQIPSHFYDFIINNDSTLETLYCKADYVAQHMLSPARKI